MQWISLPFYFSIFVILFSLINAVKICKKENRFYISENKLKTILCAVGDSLDRADVVEIVLLSGGLSYFFFRYGSSIEIIFSVFLFSLLISCVLVLLIIVSTGVRSAVFVNEEGDVRAIVGEPEKEKDYRLLVWKAKGLTGKDDVKGIIIFWSYVNEQGIMSVLTDKIEDRKSGESVELFARQITVHVVSEKAVKI